MILRLAFLVLLLTALLNGVREPTPSMIREGTQDIDKVKPVIITTVVNSMVSCINVFLSWISFLIPPSNMRARLTVLMTAFIVETSIINNVFSNVPTSEEETLVRLINMIQPKFLDPVT